MAAAARAAEAGGAPTEESLLRASWSARDVVTGGGKASVIVSPSPQCQNGSSKSRRERLLQSARRPPLMRFREENEKGAKALESGLRVKGERERENSQPSIFHSRSTDEETKRQRGSSVCSLFLFSLLPSQQQHHHHGRSRCLARRAEPQYAGAPVRN